MRVLHTLASLRPESGGPARSVPALALAQSKLGVDAQLWIADGTLGETDLPLHAGNLRQVVHQIGAIDLIHDHGLWLSNNHQTAGLSRTLPIPRVVSPRGMLEPWALQHKRWKKRIAWTLYQRRDLASAAALHATAQSEADQFKKLGLKSPIFVVPNGVDLNHPTESQRSDSSPRTALFLGRIHPKKGLPMLIKAWNKVRPTNWHMLVVGPDESGHRAELEREVNRCGLEGSWSFSDAVEGTEKSSRFQSAELFILPTHSENFGLAIAEAFAFALPVITTTGAPWSGISERNCGWWVRPEVDSIESALRAATGCSSCSLRKMGERGRDWMAADFGWEKVASQMIADYEQILRNSHASAD